MAQRSLSPTEARVAQLAAGSLSNAEVAERLGLSIKTVEGHLARVYRKLGISTRAELATLGPNGPLTPRGEPESDS